MSADWALYQKGMDESKDIHFAIDSMFVLFLLSKNDIQKKQKAYRE